MPTIKYDRKFLTTLRVSINTIFDHKIIIYPFWIIAFSQLLLLEILYFAPRYHLNVFFGPIIKKLWSEQYLHYPYDLVLLPKLFQNGQIPIYIFISSLFIGVCVYLIKEINNSKKVTIKKALREVLPLYLNLLIVTVLSVVLMGTVSKSYGWVYDWATFLNGQGNGNVFLNALVNKGWPYLNLMASVFITVLFAYVIPVLVIEKLKIVPAVIRAVKFLFRHFWFTVGLVVIPSLFFLPVLVLRQAVASESSVPEMKVFLMVASILVVNLIDLIVYTAVTTLYLYEKESV